MDINVPNRKQKKTNEKMSRVFYQQSTNDNEKHSGAVKLLLTSVGNDRTSRNKKWWRFFKWLPTPKAFKFSSRSAAFSENIVDIQCNREEYSLTPCYVGNHRLV